MNIIDIFYNYNKNQLNIIDLYKILSKNIIEIIIMMKYKNYKNKFNLLILEYFKKIFVINNGMIFKNIKILIIKINKF